MTWLEFKTKVEDNIGVHADRRGPIATQIANWIRGAVLDLQRFNHGYRTSHIRTYTISDLEVDSEASFGYLPRNAEVKAVYWSMIGTKLSRIPLHQYPWQNRNDMISGSMLLNQYVVSIDPASRQFYVYPRINDTYQIVVEWDGIQVDFVDSDEVPFDEKEAEAVSNYVLSKVAMADLDLQTAAVHKSEWISERKQIFLSESDKAVVRHTAGSPNGNIRACNPPLPENEDEIQFVAFGDFGVGNDNSRAVAALAKGFEPDFMVWLGDVNYPSGAADTFEANVMDDYDGWVPQSIYPVWGNHDLESSSGGRYGGPLADLFPSVDAVTSDEFYYDFVRGPCHFYVINSGYTDAEPRVDSGLDYTAYSGITGPAQLLWLEDQIAASTSEWNIVLFHRPGYCSDENYYPGSTAMRWPWNTLGVDLVLNGHGHNYERLLVSGVPHLVVGTGGADLRDFNSTPSTYSVKRYNTKHGLVRVHADSSHLQVVFYNVDGDIIDNFTLHQAETTSTLMAASLATTSGVSVAATNSDGMAGWFNVDTMAELAAIAHASTHKTAAVQGELVVDDGGGGVFDWRGDSTSTHDGVNIIKPDDIDAALPGRWHRMPL
jgi:hypothetical protein